MFDIERRYTGLNLHENNRKPEDILDDNRINIQYHRIDCLQGICIDRLYKGTFFPSPISTTQKYLSIKTVVQMYLIGKAPFIHNMGHRNSHSSINTCFTELPSQGERAWEDVNGNNRTGIWYGTCSITSKFYSSSTQYIFLCKCILIVSVDKIKIPCSPQTKYQQRFWHGWMNNHIINYVCGMHLFINALNVTEVQTAGDVTLWMRHHFPNT